MIVQKMGQAENSVDKSDLLLDVRDLRIAFRSDEGLVRAVDGVSFVVKPGQTVGIVGESGSGKSVTVNAIMRLLPRNGRIDGGSVHLRRKDGTIVDVTQLHPRSSTIRQIRGGDVAMIFQEPMASFSPVYTIGNQIIEAIRSHRTISKKEARAEAIDLLDRVGIANPSQRIDQYSFELSGGMRQRAMIAVALSTNPSLLIADEPTTALDVTIQAQILELLKQIQQEFGMAVIFITHDLGVIAQVADEVNVMYLGRIVERGATRKIIRSPQHPYTQSLLRAIPRLDNLGQRLVSVSGNIPSPLERPRGCVFHTRCPEFIEGRCDQEIPPSVPIDADHLVDCHLYP